MSIIIGIDPSITSTGVCVWDKDHNINKYYNIVKNPTKKLQSYKSDHISILSYNSPSTKDMSSVEKEYWKTYDVKKIHDYIATLFSLFAPDLVLMESIAMSATGRIELLAGLNYSMRLLAIQNTKMCCLTPQMIKKEFVGNGAAGKQEMVDMWKFCDANSSEYIEKFPKNSEDLADAYAIAHYPVDQNLLTPQDKNNII